MSLVKRGIGNASNVTVTVKKGGVEDLRALVGDYIYVHI